MGKLKITDRDFEDLRFNIQSILDAHPEYAVQYSKGLFPRAEKTKDLNKRFRWDLFWNARSLGYGDSILWNYLDDMHIDSALKRIVPTIERLY